MPHIIIEYAQTLADEHDLDAVCKSLFNAALASGVFTEPKDIKVRAIAASNWYQAAENQSFVHITVRLIAGRTEEQKSTVTNAIFEELEKRLPTVGTISVDIKELAPATYKRRTL